MVGFYVRRIFYILADDGLTDTYPNFSDEGTDHP